MNSWKLLSALILTLALTSVLAFPQKRASEEPADDGINEVGGGDVDGEIDEGGDDYDPGLSEDGNETEDDEAAEELAAMCEALAEDGVEKRSLIKRGFFRKLFEKVKGFVKKVGSFGKKVIDKIKHIGRKIKQYGKRSVEGNEEEDDEAAEDLVALCEALSADDVDKRSLIKRGFFSNFFKRVKGFGKKVGNFGKKVGNFGRKVIGKIKHYGRKIKQFGKKSVDGNEEENEQKKRALEEFVSSTGSQDVGVAKRQGKDDTGRGRREVPRH